MQIFREFVRKLSLFSGLCHGRARLRDMRSSHKNSFFFFLSRFSHFDGPQERADSVGLSETTLICHLTTATMHSTRQHCQVGHFRRKKVCEFQRKTFSDYFLLHSATEHRKNVGKTETDEKKILFFSFATLFIGSELSPESRRGKFIFLLFFHRRFFSSFFSPSA